MKSRTLLELDGIIRGNDNSGRIAQIDKWLLTLNKPLTFSGSKGLEIRYQKDYTEACLYLKKELNSSVDNMTVLEFYSAFEYIKKNLKSKSKNHGRRN